MFLFVFNQFESFDFYSIRKHTWIIFGHSKYWLLNATPVFSHCCLRRASDRVVCYKSVCWKFSKLGSVRNTYMSYYKVARSRCFLFLIRYSELWHFLRHGQTIYVLADCCNKISHCPWFFFQFIYAKKHLLYFYLFFSCA